MIGHNPVELGMWVDSESRQRMVDKLKEQGKVRDIETQFVRKSGEIIDILGFAEMIEIAGQQYILSLAYDITDRKRAEEELRESERYLKKAQEAGQLENAKLFAMISAMEEGVVFADSSNVIVEVNQYFCNFVGRKREEILGKTIEEFHLDNVREKVMKHIEFFRASSGSEVVVVQRAVGEAEVVFRIQPIYVEGHYTGVLVNVVERDGLRPCKAHGGRRKQCQI